MSKRCFRAMRVWILLLAMALVGASALADGVEVKLNDAATIYQSASTSAKHMKAPKGLRVKLKAAAKGWGKITYKGRTAYIKLKYLDRVEPLKAYVTDASAIYREAGGGDKLSDVSAGTAVYVLGVNGSYVRVTNKSGSLTGYIKASVLSAGKVSSGDSGSGASAGDSVPESLQATADGAKESKIERTIFVAQALIGTPYAKNAEPPKTFDCAKYANYCYGAAQSDVLKSSSGAQGYDERFAKIDYDDLKRGDLVCFDTVSDEDLCDHVGIYLGGGYFLHGSSAAKKVILSSLRSGYYKRTFSWGRRIFDE